MKRLLVVLVAGLLVFVVAAAPASAKDCQPAKGRVDVQFNMGVFSSGAAPEVSYIGDVTFGEETYTLVWYPLMAPYPAQGQLFSVLEDWKIYDDREFYDFDPVSGVITRFEPDEADLVLAGSDVAYGNPGSQFRGYGEVTDGPATTGPLGCVPEGSSGRWHGTYDTPELGPGTHFLGKLGIFPTNG